MRLMRSFNLQKDGTDMMLEIGPNLTCLIMLGLVFALLGLMVWRA